MKPFKTLASTSFFVEPGRCYRMDLQPDDEIVATRLRDGKFTMVVAAVGHSYSRPVGLDNLCHHRSIETVQIGQIIRGKVLAVDMDATPTMAVVLRD